MSKAPYRLLFVCMGNICRSPAGEGVMLQVLEKEGLSDQVECDSAGTIGFHSGNPADSRMRASAKKRGYLLDSRSRQIHSADLEAFDLILVMDEDNYSGVAQLATDAAQLAKIKRFCEFCSEYEDSEVPDPYYGGDAGFEHVLDLLEDGCQGILAEVKKQIR